MPVTGQTNNLNNSPLATTISASIYLSHTNKRNNHIQIREEQTLNKELWEPGMYLSQNHKTNITGL